MIPVPAHRQSEAYCGPASLRIVLDHSGIKKSERTLARLAGTTRAKGTTAAGMIRAAKAVGFEATVHDGAELKDVKHWLKKGIPVIVHWFSINDHHYSVAVGLDRTHIHLMDPYIGEVQSFTHKVFNRIWFGFRDDTLNQPEDIVLRRMIVVKPKQQVAQKRSA